MQWFVDKILCIMFIISITFANITHPKFGNPTGIIFCKAKSINISKVISPPSASHHAIMGTSDTLYKVCSRSHFSRCNLFKVLKIRPELKAVQPDLILYLRENSIYQIFLLPEDIRYEKNSILNTLYDNYYKTDTCQFHAMKVSQIHQGLISKWINL